VGLENASRARTALAVTSNRIEELGALRGQLGASESRLNSALSVLGVQRENFKAAESRIRDADIASEAGVVGRNVNFKETPLTKGSSEVRDEEIQSVKRWGAPDHP
jgi:flagellin